MFSRQFFKILLVSLLLMLLSGCSDNEQHTLLTIDSNQSTAGVLCNYQYNQYNSSKSVEATNSVAYWSCDSNSRDIDANGISEHPVGKFPNLHNSYIISEQSVMESYPLHPVETKIATRFGVKQAVIGVMLNGVEISGNISGSCYDLGEKCSLTDYRGHWSIEAIGQHIFDLGIDANNAHVQPDGTYHARKFYS